MAATCCKANELKAVQDIILKNSALNAAIVQPAYKIAEPAGISVPANTKILIGEVKLVDESEPFAHENCHRRSRYGCGEDYVGDENEHSETHFEELALRFMDIRVSISSRKWG